MDRRRPFKDQGRWFPDDLDVYCRHRDCASTGVLMSSVIFVKCLLLIKSWRLAAKYRSIKEVATDATLGKRYHVLNATYSEFAILTLQYQ